jgi:hypothetical protein
MLGLLRVRFELCEKRSWIQCRVELDDTLVVDGDRSRLLDRQRTVELFDQLAERALLAALVVFEDATGIGAACSRRRAASASDTTTMSRAIRSFLDCRMWNRSDWRLHVGDLRRSSACAMSVPGGAGPRKK